MASYEKRDEYGLRPVADKPLVELRKQHAVAPHSGALFQDQHRKKAVRGYAGQAHAHDVGRKMMEQVEDESTPASPFNQHEMGLAATAMHLHATLPGPDLEAGLSHGFPAFSDVGSLKKEDERGKLASDIHERREQAKMNWMKAAEKVPRKKRRRMTMPSPPRETMDHDGVYMSPVPPEWSAFDSLPSGSESDSGSGSESEKRELVRRVVRPLSEPAWKPKPRGKSELPTPFHGDDAHEARDAFLTQDAHKGEVGHDATAKYIVGQVPDDDEVRVSAVPSVALFKTNKRSVGAGAHEVKPTDTREKIAALPDHTRTVVAHTQADVRPSTVTTFFRGKDL